MNTKVYVENLDIGFTQTELTSLFSPYGDVADAGIVLDRVSGKSCGSGIVTMATPEGARAAILALHGKDMGARTLIARDALLGGRHAGPPSRQATPRRAASQLF